MLINVSEFVMNCCGNDYCVSVLKAGDKLAGVNTLKRKRQLRELVENLNEGHDDDFNDSMPLRKRSKRLEVLLCISPNVTLGLLTVLLPF